MKKSFIGNQRGFSLFEIVMALGMMSLLSVGVMRINQMSIKGQKTLEQKTNRSSFQMELLSIFTNKEACVNTLSGLNPNGTPGALVTAIRSKDDLAGAARDLYLPGANIGEGSSGYLVLRDIYIGRYNAATGVAYLTINMAKPLNNEANSYGGDTVSFSIPLKVQLDAAGLIENCFTEQDEYQSAMCVSLGGIWDEDNALCKSIRVEAATTADYSINAVQGMKVNESLYVGPDGVAPSTGGIGVNTAATGDGNVDLSGTLTASNAQINGNLNATMFTNLGLGFAAPGSTLTVNGASTFNGTTVTTGDATINGTIRVGTATAQISAVGSDINIANNLYTGNIFTSHCPAGQVAILTGGNGGITCLDPASAAQQCFNTATELRAMEGFNANGTPRCKTVMRFNAACGAGSVISNITFGGDGSASPQCCTPDCTTNQANYCYNQNVISNNTCSAACPNKGTKPAEPNFWAEISRNKAAIPACQGTCRVEGTNTGTITKVMKCMEGACGGSTDARSCAVGAETTETNPCTFQCVRRLYSNSFAGTFTLNIPGTIVSDVEFYGTGGGGGGGYGDQDGGRSYAGRGGAAGTYETYIMPMNAAQSIGYCRINTGAAGQGQIYGEADSKQGGTTNINCYSSGGVGIPRFGTSTYYMIRAAGGAGGCNECKGGAGDDDGGDGAASQYYNNGLLTGSAGLGNGYNRRCSTGTSGGGGGGGDDLDNSNKHGCNGGAGRAFVRFYYLEKQ